MCVCVYVYVSHRISEYGNEMACRLDSSRRVVFMSYFYSCGFSVWLRTSVVLSHLQFNTSFCFPLNPPILCSTSSLFVPTFDAMWFDELCLILTKNLLGWIVVVFYLLFPCKHDIVDAGHWLVIKTQQQHSHCQLSLYINASKIDIILRKILLLVAMRFYRQFVPHFVGPAFCSRTVYLKFKTI